MISQTLATRDDFFRARELPFRDVSAPEFGDGMVVRLMALDGRRGGQFRDMVRRFQADGRESDIPLAYVACYAVNEDGTALFTANDVDQLAALHWDLIARIFTAAIELTTSRRAEVVENFEPPQG